MKCCNVIQQHILYSKALISCAANAPAGFMAYSHYGDKKTMLQRLINIKHSGERSKLAKGGLLLVAASMLSGLAIAKQPEAMTKEDHISPTIRIEPAYPIQAAQQGISGSVVLKYDIAANGKEAVDMMNKFEYDLVFMDCQMPEMDGYEATRQIRMYELQTNRRQLVIAMTANAMLGDREKCITAGMDDYISKPVKVDVLSQILSKWLPGHPDDSSSAPEKLSE